MMGVRGDSCLGKKKCHTFLEDGKCSVHFSILGDCVTLSLELIEAETNLVKLHKNVTGKRNSN